MNLLNTSCETNSALKLGRFQSTLLSALAIAILTPLCAHAGFTGNYALNQFTFTQTNLNPSDAVAPNGSFSSTPEGWLTLTGSYTGSDLFPGAQTDLTITARGTGQVSFDWVYSSLDIPEYDIAGYLLNGDFTALADTDGQFGSISFPVIFGQTFGFRVRTLDNLGEPGVLTIKSFEAPDSVIGSPVPEPASFALMLIAGAAGLLGRRHILRVSAEGNKK